MSDISLLCPKPSVLVVEDDPAALASIVGILGEHFDLLIARTLNDARRLVSPDIDLILLDLYLENESGLEFLRHVRNSRMFEFVPVVITSGSHLESDIEGAFEIGAVDYVLKPYNKTILRAKVRVAIDLKMKTVQLARAAFVDPLTGAANRRMFEERLNSEWRRAGRQGTELSLICVDLDNFKRINDTIGHAGGDVCLKALARTMERTMARAGDVVARLGGDEFAAILPNTSLRDAIQVAQRLQAELGLLSWRPDESGETCPPFTTSIGCASMVPDARVSPEELTRKADLELYKAKGEGGRDCVRPFSAAKSGSLKGLQY